MKYKFLSTVITLILLPAASYASEINTSEAINTLNLNELAQTYNAEKIQNSTNKPEASAADAVLIDMGVINTEDLGNTQLLTSKLNAFINDQADLTEQYLGNVSDKNIVERMLKTWNDSTVIQDKETLNQLNSFIDNGYTTGYNVINLNDDSHFNPELMIRYGHNNIQHAVQLIYLMKSEGFDPKMQFTPKSSAFLYLPEWGEPNYSVTTLASGKMVSVVKEYNLDFEFQTPQNKQNFMTLINQYAKKDSADEAGLLFESWWQPFYRSYTEMEGYKVLTENRVMMGDYQADLMSLPENAKQQQQQVQSAVKDIQVQATKVWVNPAFYRYMHGEFK